ncbi:MAG TPA: CpsD/CapB family tyrosine-protein kinase [Candidatus Binatia bacterium]|nr:CpsD/CapB family tyrosine-protein kinase [Candidatus Binatia bacterium]
MTSPVASERSHQVDGLRRTPQRKRKGGPGAGALLRARLARGASRQWLFVAILATAFSAFGLWFHTAGGARLIPSMIAFYVGLGAGAAVLLGILRELGRNTITSVSSLGKNRGYTILGAAPELSARALRQLPPDQRSPFGCVTNDAASPFATAFRDLQGNVATDGVVAFIGSYAGEGATTSALCVAASASQQGRSVIVVDCDLRRRSLTRGFGLAPELGVLEACERPEFWRDYVEEEHETGLNFMPAAKPLSPWRTLIGHAGFPSLLNHLREAYDFVVLDCSPALGSAEGPMVARLAQRSVIVAVWDQTPIGAIRHTMRTLRRNPGATGVYVNRVPQGYRFGRLRPD